MKEFFRIKPDNLTEFDKIVLVSLGLLILVFIFFLSKSILFVKESKKGLLKPHDTNKEIVCEVNGFRTRFNKNIFEYYVNDKKYETNRHNTFPLYIGEQYLGRYLLSDPEICYVDITQPLIDSSLFDKAICRVIKVDSDTDNKSFIVFTYLIEGEKLRRQVYVRNNSDFVEGDHYTIFFNKTYPKISYIVNKK